MTRRSRFEKADVCNICNQEKYNAKKVEFYVGQKLGERVENTGGATYQKVTSYSMDHNTQEVIICRDCLRKKKLKRLPLRTAIMVGGCALYVILHDTNFIGIGGIAAFFGILGFVCNLFSTTKSEAKELLEAAGYTAVLSKAEYKKLHQSRD